MTVFYLTTRPLPSYTTSMDATLLIDCWSYREPPLTRPSTFLQTADLHHWNGWLCTRRSSLRYRPSRVQDVIKRVQLSCPSTEA
jgi:hypothetical protein